MRISKLRIPREKIDDFMEVYKNPVPIDIELYPGLSAQLLDDHEDVGAYEMYQYKYKTYWFARDRTSFVTYYR